MPQVLALFARPRGSPCRTTQAHLHSWLDSHRHTIATGKFTHIETTPYGAIHKGTSSGALPFGHVKPVGTEFADDVDDFVGMEGELKMWVGVG
eukprot:m.1242691 g.1242691  ORF g.1242691 m.1242691 type:complete len:93 (-) comp24683_c0_seq19:1552-1830(-)